MGSPRKFSAAAWLSDDLIVEILSRLPARSVLRFQGVSRYWRDLICHPDHRGKLAHTVSGFFYYTVTPASSHRRQRTPICASFVAMASTSTSDLPIPMIDPAFLPGMELLDSCNGLLLLRGYRSASVPTPAGYFYVVCNPTTRQSVELPQPSHAFFDDQQQEKRRTRSAALAFDPAVSSHFHVFQLVEKDLNNLGCYHFVEAVEIYSSETGRWDLRNSGWRVGGHVAYTGGGNFAFLNGALYFCAGVGAAASVDTRGQAWGLTSVVPAFRASSFGHAGFIGRSQGRLLYVDVGPDRARRLRVYALDAGKQRWSLHHRADGLCFGKHLTVVAVHQDCDRVFLFDSL